MQIELDLDDYQEPEEALAAYADGIDMRYLVNKIGGSLHTEVEE